MTCLKCDSHFPIRPQSPGLCPVTHTYLRFPADVVVWTVKWLSIHKLYALVREIIGLSGYAIEHRSSARSYFLLPAFLLHTTRECNQL